MVQHPEAPQTKIMQPPYLNTAHNAKPYAAAAAEVMDQVGPGQAVVATPHTQLRDV